MLYMKLLVKERLRIGRRQPTLPEDEIVKMRHTLQNIVSEIGRLEYVYSKADKIRQLVIIPRSGMP